MFDAQVFAGIMTRFMLLALALYGVAWLMRKAFQPRTFSAAQRFGIVLICAAPVAAFACIAYHSGMEYSQDYLLGNRHAEHWPDVAGSWSIPILLIGAVLLFASPTATRTWRWIRQGSTAPR